MEKLFNLTNERKGNTLLTFDFPFGYPHGSSLRGARDAAQLIASQMMDTETDFNNRFEVGDILNQKISNKSGPFWGHPKSQSFDNLTWYKPPFAHGNFQEWRLCERLLRLEGKKIMNVWQLLGQGSVGSQTLTGLSRLHEYCRREEIRNKIQFWPFETNWDHNLEGIILAEVWPSLNNYSEIEHPIKDARQVLACLQWLKQKNDTGQIRDFFKAPNSLSIEEQDQCRTEEGWILGVE